MKKGYSKAALFLASQAVTFPVLSIQTVFGDDDFHVTVQFDGSEEEERLYVSPTSRYNDDV